MKTQRKIAYFLLAAIMLFASIFSARTPVASALTQAEREAIQKENEELKDRIESLKGQIADYEKQASDLASKADSIEVELESLRTQEANLKTQIYLKQAEYDQLVLEIENIENRIKANSDIVSVIISEYYYNSEVSTIERLASSESFSSYLDNEVRLGNMADSVVAIIEENKNLREDAINKRDQAKGILDDLELQRSELQNMQVRQQEILNSTRQSMAEYENLKRESDKERAALEAEQEKNNQKLYVDNNSSIMPSSANKGGYPYRNECPAAKLNHRQYPDQWGMYICECVSYTAWRVQNAYGRMPYWGGHGNANQWLANARAAGYVVSNVPKPGAVGISMSGPYGHAVWVESVPSPGRVHISQYNFRIGGIPAGQYSEMETNSSSYTYIYFDQKTYALR